jgi:(S)-mandelate dehydrogenase
MERKYYTGSDVEKALSIEELRQMALRRLPGFVAEYVESGGEDEVSLSWNREVFKWLRFIPKTLVDTGHRHTRTKLLGRELPSPFIIAPMGHCGIIRRNADVALARAAAAEGIPYTLSTLSNTRVESLPGQAPGALWMQLYVFKDQSLTDDILRRAEAAGYEALVFTTDSNVFGWREWDRRHFEAPGQLTSRSMLDIVRHPKWFFDTILPHGIPRLENVVDYFPPDARDTRSAVTRIPNLFVPTITWDHVEELRRRWRGKLIIKGILRVDDARRAADLGCDGIVLTNHGGRHLDSCITPMEALPEISAEVGNRLAIIIDSGFRRGSDVVKAIALGAHAVMIGRAALYGVAAGGEKGARHALRLLSSEMHRVLGQLGCNSLADLGPHLLKRYASQSSEADCMIPFPSRYSSNRTEEL